MSVVGNGGRSLPLAWFSGALAALGVLVAFLVPALAQTPSVETPLPVEKYAEIPFAQTARLSPDGNRLAIIASYHGRQVLLIHVIHGGDKMVALGDNQARWVAWKSDQRMIAGVSKATEYLFFSANVGDTERVARLTRMFGIDGDGTHAVDLGEPPGGFIPEAHTVGGNIHPQIQDDLAGLLLGDPHYILQTVIDQVATRSVTPAVYRVDVDTGVRTRILKPEEHISRFRTDTSGVVRLGFGLEGTDEVVFVRDDAQSSWRPVHRRKSDDPSRFEALAFIPDHPNQLYVVASDSATGAPGLWAFDTTTAKLDHLIDGDVADPDHPEVVDGRLVSYVTAHDHRRRYLDPAWQKDFELVSKALPGRRLHIVDRTLDGGRVLFEIAEPYQPNTWWIVDRTVKPNQLSPVIETYPDILQSGIAPVERVQYTARDGLVIAANLTMPRGPRSGPIPFVVLPHDGPNACNGDGFDYQAQFLASRGWGVLQPEFRGSSCGNITFEQRGNGQWGYAMQDDLTDGTRWLIEQKRADPAHVCIVGSGYGGYAALEGAAKEPSLYSCAAAWAPVTDLTQLRADTRRFFEKDVLREKLGDDAARLAAASPINQVARIAAPILLMHDTTDPRYDVSYSRSLESALKAAGKPVDAIYVEGSDNLRLEYPARLAWLKALDSFLGDHLGRPAPPE